MTLAYYNQEFRNVEGNFVENPQADLEIPLIDFASETLTSTFDQLRETICISSRMLYTFLEKAERIDHMLKIKRTESSTGTLKPWVRKRRRDSTPPEQLSSDRERSFVEDEERAIKRAAKDDSSYKASSSYGTDSE